MAKGKSLVKERIEQFERGSGKNEAEPQIDIFDFNQYPKDRDLFKKHFHGVELYLRLAIWISYKYGYNLSKKDQKALDKDVTQKRDGSERTKAEVKQFLETMSDAFVPKNLLTAWYQHFAPQMINKVDEILVRYALCEDELFNRLYKKYVDPEWVSVPLWFHDERCDDRRKEKEPAPAAPQGRPEQLNQDRSAAPRERERAKDVDPAAVREQLENISQQIIYYKSLLKARETEAKNISERRDEILDQAVEETRGLSGVERSEAIARYIAENTPLELMSMDEAKRMRDRLREQLQQQLQREAILRETGLYDDDEEATRADLVKSIADITAKIDEPRFASKSYIMAVLETLKTQRDILKNRLDLLEGMKVDVRRDEGVQRMVKKVVAGIRRSRKHDQYYNIATDSSIGANKPGVFYDERLKLAHTDKQQLRQIVRIMREVLTVPEAKIPEGVTFSEKRGKTGSHEYASIPAELWNRFKVTSDAPVDKVKSIRTSNPKYVKFLQNYNAQYQPTDVLESDDIDAALERLKVVQTRHQQDMHVDHRRNVDNTIIVQDFPATVVEDVLVPTPYGKMQAEKVEASSMIVYNTYAVADSEKDNELQSNPGATFLGKYNKISTNNSFVREDLVQQRDMAPIITTTQYGYTFFAKVRNTGEFVWIPEFYHQAILAPGRQFLPAQYQGRMVMVAESTKEMERLEAARSQQQRLVTNSLKRADEISRARSVEQKRDMVAQLLRDVRDRFVEIDPSVTYSLLSRLISSIATGRPTDSRFQARIAAVYTPQRGGRRDVNAVIEQQASLIYRTRLRLQTILTMPRHQQDREYGSMINTFRREFVPLTSMGAPSEGEMVSFFDRIYRGEIVDNSVLAEHIQRLYSRSLMVCDASQLEMVTPEGAGRCTSPEDVQRVYEGVVYVKVSGVDYYVPYGSAEFQDLLHSGRDDIERDTSTLAPVVYNKYRVEKLRGEPTEFRRRRRVKGFPGFTS